MKFEKKTVEGKFILRHKRFTAEVMIDGKKEICHVPNTGRLGEILLPEVRCLLRCEDGENRKTRYSLIGAWKGDSLINIDSQIPNAVVEEALKKGMIDKLRSYDIIEREKTFGSSRFDFRLSNGKGEVYYLEVKGVTLENNGVMSFPDAVTERGAKHLNELREAVNQGFGAGVLFLIQMEDAKYFTPNTERDPYFSECLEKAADSGVDILAYTCRTREDELTLYKDLEVRLRG